MRLLAPALTVFTLVSLSASAAFAQSHDHAAMSHTAPAQATSAASATGLSGQSAIINGEGTEIGQAILSQGPAGLLLKVTATGLTPGWHGIHIHATGQCAAPFTSAGAHINHTDPKVPHGLLNADGPDDGDLPNVFADATGAVNAEIFTTRARISQEGPGQWLWDADGSALVIHAQADDHTSQPIGGAGDRVACAVLSAN